MSLEITREKGVPLDRQRFTWRELAGRTISKLDDDAFTRVRIILMSGIELMNGIESESLRFKHVFSRMTRDLRLPLAQVRRAEHHQQTMVNWLLPAAQSPLETTIGFEQVAIEVTASIAQSEPDPYLAQVYRFGLLEDFDHLYRYSALMDRVEGKDANNFLQSYTDILPGRPTAFEHRAPEDDLRRPYDRTTAMPITKLNALTLVAGAYQPHDYYMTIGPTFSDPIARGLYAEIASIEEQHVTQYESLTDPDETFLEKWLLQEATEAYNYWSCLRSEPRGAAGRGAGRQRRLGHAAAPRARAGLRRARFPVRARARGGDRPHAPGAHVAEPRDHGPGRSNLTTSESDRRLCQEVGSGRAGHRRRGGRRCPTLLPAAPRVGQSFF